MFKTNRQTETSVAKGTEKERKKGKWKAQPPLSVQTYLFLNLLWFHNPVLLLKHIWFSNCLWLNKRVWFYNTACGSTTPVRPVGSALVIDSAASFRL